MSYNWAACLQEPWDGPASFAFSDSRYWGASFDPNGLRPRRYVATDKDIIVCASKVGAIFISPENIVSKGRLKPGRMLLVDTVEGRIADDKELKRATTRKQNFGSWVESSQTCSTFRRLSSGSSGPNQSRSRSILTCWPLVTPSSNSISSCSRWSPTERKPPACIPSKRGQSMIISASFSPR